MASQIRIRDVSAESSSGIMAHYRTLSLGAAAIFLIVGMAFLLFPSGVLAFFNGISQGLGLKPSVTEVPGLYLALTVGYMSTVTILAVQMARNPTSWVFPLLLAQAKAASSFFSLVFYIFSQPSFILLANFAVDGMIAAAAFAFYRKIKRMNP